MGPVKTDSTDRKVFTEWNFTFKQTQDFFPKIKIQGQSSFIFKLS